MVDEFGGCAANSASRLASPWWCRHSRLHRAADADRSAARTADRRIIVGGAGIALKNLVSQPWSTR